MNFDTFQELILDQIRAFLPETMQDVELRVEEVTKLNETYRALLVEKEGWKIVPRVNLDALYKEYRAQTMELLRDRLQEVADSLMRDWKGPEAVREELFQLYPQAREHLCIRLSDANVNRELLQTLPHREREGLAMTCHLFFGQEEGRFLSAAVTEEMRKKYGVSREQLLEDAVQNSERILPAVFFPLDERIWLLEDIPFSPEALKSGMARGMERLKRGLPELYVLTNEQRVNGASALFYPGTMEEIAEGLANSYFILPSSIHEVLILPEEEKWLYGNLPEVVQQVNRIIAPGDRLSDQVFHFDREAGLFETMSGYQRRIGRGFS